MDKEYAGAAAENEKLKKEVLKLKVHILDKNKQIVKLVRLSVKHDQELGNRNKEIAGLKKRIRELR